MDIITRNGFLEYLNMINNLFAPYPKQKMPKDIDAVQNKNRKISYDEISLSSSCLTIANNDDVQNMSII